MKRIICILVANIILSVANAEITRSIYDITLGSSLEMVKSNLDNRGLSYSVFDTKMGLCICVQNPYFSGVYWDFLLVSFDRGIAYSITFNKKCNNMMDKLSLMKESMTLMDNLSLKYSQYKDQRTNSSKQGDDLRINYVFSDRTTCILFVCDFLKNDTSRMYITYLDEDMYIKMDSKHPIDDL